MTIEMLVTILLVGYAINTIYRGVRLLQNRELMLSIKRNQKIYSNLSPQDHRLFGGVHVVVGGLFIIVTALAFAGAVSATVYNACWLLLGVVVIGGPPMMKRRSRPVSAIDSFETPTVES